MSITWEQVRKINAKMSNGWELDLNYYLMHGEKTAVLQIPQDDGGYIQGKIYIDNVYNWRPNSYNGIVLKINVSRWYKGHTDGVYTSHGLGHWIEIQRPDLKKCLFSAVQKYTAQITAEDVQAIYNGDKEGIDKGRSLFSGDICETA